MCAFQQALKAFGASSAAVLRYEQLLQDGLGCLSELPPHTALRIESPGRDFALYKRFLAEGYTATVAECADVISPAAALALDQEKGLILYPYQWHMGFQQILLGIADVLRARPDIHPLLPPKDILLMFDKRQCHHRLCQRDIAVPRSLGPVDSYDELRHRMHEAALSRVFVKLRYGSAASGLVAYSACAKRESAISTTELVKSPHGLKLYNSRKLTRYHDFRDIRTLIDALCRHQVHVEAWFPKAGLDGQACDCRVLVVAGQPEHVVVRASDGPMTNLHLGCRRREPAALRHRVGESSWEAAMETSHRVAATFPRSLYMGIDLAFSPCHRKHAVFEVNAFGDLLKGIRSRGLTTYEAEIDCLFRETDTLAVPAAEVILKAVTA